MPTQALPAWQGQEISQARTQISTSPPKKVRPGEMKNHWRKIKPWQERGSCQRAPRRPWERLKIGKFIPGFIFAPYRAQSRAENANCALREELQPSLHSSRLLELGRGEGTAHFSLFLFFFSFSFKTGECLFWGGSRW